MKSGAGGIFLEEEQESKKVTSITSGTKFDVESDLLIVSVNFLYCFLQDSCLQIY